MIETRATFERGAEANIHACVDVTPRALDLPARGGGPGKAPAKALMHLLASTPDNPSRITLLEGKRWAPGQTLRIAFMGGDPEVKRRVREVAMIWTRHANLKFDFDDSPSAQIRIAFLRGQGSWSYVGRDCLEIAHERPTMSLGWLDPDTSDDEYSRVVLHEFGHALGCIHEHQNPVANIPWDRDAVYAFYEGPPNEWTPEQVDLNLFATYDKEITQFTRFDPRSIMLYPIPAEHTTDRIARPGNHTLSETDIEFIRGMYPSRT
jgi:hypothetical protein